MICVRLLALLFLPQVLEWPPLMAVLVRPTGEVIGALSASSTHPTSMIPIVIVAAVNRTLLDVAQFALFRWHMQPRAWTLVAKYPVMGRWLASDSAAKASVWLTLGLSITPVVAFAAVSKAGWRMFIGACLAGALARCTAYAYAGFAMGSGVRSALVWIREREFQFVAVVGLGLATWVGVALSRNSGPRKE